MVSEQEFLATIICYTLLAITFYGYYESRENESRDKKKQPQPGSWIVFSFVIGITTLFSLSLSYLFTFEWWKEFFLDLSYFLSILFTLVVLQVLIGGRSGLMDKLRVLRTTFYKLIISILLIMLITDIITLLYAVW